jgi:hypothetical protein
MISQFIIFNSSNWVFTPFKWTLFFSTLSFKQIGLRESKLRTSNWLLTKVNDCSFYWVFSSESKSTNANWMFSIDSCVIWDEWKYENFNFSKLDCTMLCRFSIFTTVPVC